MSARASGSGTVSFGLVSIPVKTYPATSPQNVAFRRLQDTPTRAYEVSRGRWVHFTNAELQQLESEKTDRLDIVEFVPAETFDAIYIRSTHHLGPDRGGDRAYRLLADALTRSRRIAICRWGGRGRDDLVALRAHESCLVMHRLFYADEVHAMAAVDRPGPLEFKRVEQELADKLLEQLSVERFDPASYHDAYRARVIAAIDRKAAGLDVEPPACGGRVIDLFEALKRSLGEKRRGTRHGAEEG